MTMSPCTSIPAHFSRVTPIISLSFLVARKGSHLKDMLLNESNYASIRGTTIPSRPSSVSTFVIPRHGLLLRGAHPLLLTRFHSLGVRGPLGHDEFCSCSVQARKLSCGLPSRPDF